MKTVNIFIFSLLSLLFMAISQMGHAQNFDLSPAPAPSTSDGNALDQGVAYFLMLAALVITYMLH